MKKIDLSIITKLAMRKAKIDKLYDEEIEKRIIEAIRKREERAKEIKQIISPIDLL